MKSVTEFREKLNLNQKISIKSKSFQIKQIVKFRFDDNNFYYKLFLNDEYALADDLENDQFLFVKETEIDLPIKEKTVIYDGQEFEFLYSAHHVVAEKVWGQGPFKKGDTESFSDYKSSRNYLSLGYDDKTGERMDMYGEIVAPTEVSFV